ncbi:MAG: M23 family metallopeptidase [Bacillota bacterium]
MRRRNPAVAVAREAVLCFLSSGRRLLAVSGLLILCLVVAVLCLASVFVGLPVGAQAEPQWSEYRELASRLAVPVRSADGAEAAHQVTAGLLLALDVLTGSRGKTDLESAAFLLRPEFEYGSVGVWVEDPETGNKRHVSVTVLLCARAYDGVYSYRYSCAVSGTHVVPVREGCQWTPDYSRLKAAVRALTGQEPDDASAQLIAELGRSIESGRPNLSVLLVGPLERLSYSGDWPVEGEVTSGYGWRVHPVTGALEFHPGVDIGAPPGAAVRVLRGGVVRFAGQYGGYGLCVIIDHGGGLETLYGHCSAVLVAEGVRVAEGQVIALVGSTGVSTGPHLHFEVRKNGVCIDPRTTGGWR